MYNVTDLTELVRYHLVLSVDDTEVTDHNLGQLMRNIEQMVTTPRWHEPIYWVVCEDCGAWVSSVLSGPDRAGDCDDDDGFWCAECRFSGEKP